MAERMDPKPLEDFSIMMCVTHPQPCDLDVLRELVGELTKMSTQKTAGQRGGKDLSWDNLERVKMGILCEAVSLVNSGQLDEMEVALRAQQAKQKQGIWHKYPEEKPTVEKSYCTIRKFCSNGTPYIEAVKDGEIWVEMDYWNNDPEWYCWEGVGPNNFCWETLYWIDLGRVEIRLPDDLSGQITRVFDEVVSQEG